MKNKSIYNKKILKLWRNPKNFGELKNPTHEYSEANTICGDEMWIHLKVENDIVKDARFFGTGCLVCIVFASQLTEKIKGMKTKDVLKLKNANLLKLLKIKITPLKMQCACLSLNAVQNCIRKGKIKK
ncbi:MAG: iron-sulfur cluster assembly scaffold protein [Candidatus Pacearchaeota archaeon]|nr:iron-sulfur cluster assembly scaffold protein [Candidatus Pacearchaeota archaeon]